MGKRPVWAERQEPLPEAQVTVRAASKAVSFFFFFGRSNRFKCTQLELPNLDNKGDMISRKTALSPGPSLS